MQFDFLKSYIHALFDQSGFENLTEETRNQFLPQFEAEAEKRLGLALMEKLDETASEELAALLEKDQVTREELEGFWKKHVPDFDGVVGKVLDDFAKEFKTVLEEVK